MSLDYSALAERRTTDPRTRSAREGIAPMRRTLVWLATVIVTALLQTTWLNAIEIQGVRPSLTLILVVYFAISEGEERAMWTGVIAGLFQDVAGFYVLGHNILCNVVVGYTVGRTTTRLVTEHHAVKAVVVFGASVMFGILHVFIQYVQKPYLPTLRPLLVDVVPTSFYSALVAPILFIALDYLFRKPKPLQGI